MLENLSPFRMILHLRNAVRNVVEAFGGRRSGRRRLQNRNSTAGSFKSFPTGLFYKTFSSFSWRQDNVLFINGSRTIYRLKGEVRLHNLSFVI